MQSRLEAEFDTWWRQLGAGGSGKQVFQQLYAAYQEPQRHYHTLAHLGDCLRQLRDARLPPTDEAVLGISLWFHDAVYNPKAGDNEERSALWAEQSLRDAAIKPDRIQEVTALIRATKRHLPEGSPLAPLMLDIDLSILGAAPERFDEYEQQIQREYDWVPRAQYRQGRRAILQQFLQRPRLYFTAGYREHLEERARANLRHALGKLETD